MQAIYDLLRDANQIFHQERLNDELFDTVYERAKAFRAAFADFDVDRVAAFGPADLDRLLADSGIIRNRLKIEATAENARRIQALRKSHGSFAGWLDAHHPRQLQEWTRLFRQAFRFTGGQIVNEFLMSVGYLPGAHEPDCPIFTQILKHSPPWARVPAFDAGDGFARKSLAE